MLTEAQNGNMVVADHINVRTMGTTTETTTSMGIEELQTPIILHEVTEMMGKTVSINLSPERQVFRIAVIIVTKEETTNNHWFVIIITGIRMFLVAVELAVFIFRSITIAVASDFDVS